MIRILGRQVLLSLIDLVLEESAELYIHTTSATRAAIRAARTRTSQCLATILLSIITAVVDAIQAVIIAITGYVIRAIRVTAATSVNTATVHWRDN